MKMTHRSRSLRRWSAGTLVCAASLLLLLAVQAGAQTFTNDIVDYGDGSSNVFSTMDIGPDGKIYCLWKDGGTAGVAGATGPATYKLIRWNTTTSAWDSIGSFPYTNVPNTDTTFGIGDDIPLAIDSNNGFHCAFILPNASPLGNKVVYATSANGSSWAFTQLVNFTAINDSPGQVDLYVDQNNHPHVFFLESNVGQAGGPPWTARVWTVWHYFYNGSAWVSETAYSQNGGSGASPNEITLMVAALDSAGKAHVAVGYESNGGGTDASLGYVTNAGGSWSGLTQLAAGATGAVAASNIAIATDASNKVHIIRRAADFKMYYHTNASGSFTNTWMNGDLLGNVKSNCRPLVINSQGDIFCLFNGQTQTAGGNPGIVKYACLFGGTGSTWQIGDVMTTSPANTRTGQFIAAAFTDSRLAMATFDHYTNTGGNPSYNPNRPRQLQYATATVLPGGQSGTTVSSLSRVGTTPTNAAAVSWTLTFGSAVTGLAASNLSITGAGATGASIGTPTTSNGGVSYTIPVTTGSDGTLTLNLANSTGLSQTISTTLPYAGESYTIDKGPPVVQTVTRLTPLNQTTNLTTVVFRVTYSEPVTLNAPESGHFAVIPVNGSNIVGSVTGVTGTGATRDVTVNLTSGAGEFRLRVID